MNKPGKQRVTPWPTSWGACAFRYANLAIQLGFIGKVIGLPCDVVFPDDQYEDRKGFLNLVANRLESFDDEFRDTIYYQQKLQAKGKRTADMLARRFRNLYISIRDKGFIQDPEKPETFPRVFIADGQTYRLHGAHRLSVIRHLGHKEVNCTAIVPDDLTIDVLIKVKQACKKIKIKKTAYAQIKAERRIRAEKKWYQSIEVFPGFWTRRKGWQKPALLTEALPICNGLNVLDIGCNAGVHTLMAARNGAAKAIGIDAKIGYINQANMIKEIWRRCGYDVDRASFVVGHILGHPELFEDVDIVILALVLYHIGQDVPELMKMIVKSNVKILIMQGNVWREGKNPYAMPDEMTALGREYGFNKIRVLEGGHPVVVAQRELKK